jgi:hypothetical protein
MHQCLSEKTAKLLMTGASLHQILLNDYKWCPPFFVAPRQPWRNFMRQSKGENHLHKVLQEVQRGNKGIALLILNLGARWRWVVNATSRPLYPRERALVPIVQIGYLLLYSCW